MERFCSGHLIEDVSNKEVGVLGVRARRVLGACVVRPAVPVPVLGGLPRLADGLSGYKILLGGWLLASGLSRSRPPCVERKVAVAVHDDRQHFIANIVQRDQHRMFR